MIKNIFEDNGKAVVCEATKQVFSFVFSSDSHIIAESPYKYRYATISEQNLLESYLKGRTDSQPRFLKLPTISRVQRNSTS